MANFVVLLFGSGWPAARGAIEAPARPNMVLFVADDLGWRDVGCYGSPDVRTPHLDRLAAEGMRFANAYTASTTCGPTRAQLYNGMYPVNSRAYFNHPSHYVRDGVKTLPAALKELGYRVGIVGKIDAGPVEAYPFELLARGKDSLLGEACREFIRRDPAQPFCLVIGSHWPHSPWSRKAEGLTAATITVPGHLVDTPATRDALLLYYGSVQALDREVGDCFQLLADTGQTNALVLFTSEQGAEVPFGKGTLFDHGMKLAVLARWPGHVPPGSVCDAIIQHIDFLPTLVAVAGGKPPADVDGKSFLPLLTGRAIQNHDFAYGSYGDQRAVRTKKFKYIRHLDPEKQIKDGPSPFNTGAMASDPAHKFYPNWSHPKSWLPVAETNAAAARKVAWFRRRAPEELFAIEQDPFEVNNVADDPAYAGILADLRAKCDAIMAAQNDEGMPTVAALKRWNQEQHKAGKGYWGASDGKIIYPGRK
jgi:N-sulfoglucosamine sulfohydrolase